MRSFLAHTLSAFILVALAIPADAAIVSVTGPNGANGADADPGAIEPAISAVLSVAIAASSDAAAFGSFPSKWLLL